MQVFLRCAAGLAVLSGAALCALAGYVAWARNLGRTPNARPLIYLAAILGAVGIGGVSSGRRLWRLEARGRAGVMMFLALSAAGSLARDPTDPFDIGYAAVSIVLLGLLAMPVAGDSCS